MQVFDDPVVVPRLPLIRIGADVDEDGLLFGHVLLLQFVADVDRRSRCQAACRAARAHHPPRTTRSAGHQRSTGRGGLRAAAGGAGSKERREVAKCQPQHGDSAVQKEQMKRYCGCKSWTSRTSSKFRMWPYCAGLAMPRNQPPRSTLRRKAA